jgi:hypothetical protein
MKFFRFCRRVKKKPCRLYLSVWPWLNTALLVLVEIINLTGDERKALEREGLEPRGGGIGEGEFEGIIL